MRNALTVGLVVAGLVTASAQQPPASSAHDAVADDLRLLAGHPALVAGVAPFHRYISSESTLPARDRELLILRTAALTRSAYVPGVRGNAASTAGLSNEEIMRVGDGPRAAGWSAFDAVLLQAADELLATSFVSDATWAALSSRYTRPQLMDAVFTVAHYSMWAMIANTTLTVTVNRPLTARQPAMPPRPARETRHHTALATPRIPPLEPSEWTPAVRAMLDPSGGGRPVAAVYRTYAQHPALYAPRQVLSEYIRTRSTLSPRVREMLILRIGFLCESEYEWAAHARAGRGAGLSDDEIRRIAAGPAAGWPPADAAILQAVDDLFEQDRVAEATWSRLATQFDQKQLLDVLVTAGGYRMVSMSLNTFGVPLEPDSERFPTSRR